MWGHCDITSWYTCACWTTLNKSSLVRLVEKYWTKNNDRKRIYEHLQDIKKGDKTSGLHYNSAAHEKAYMIVQIIEKVTPNTEFHRLEREDFWIKKLVTKAPFGLNENN